MILRLLGVQGIAGLVVSLCLGALLILQKLETRHWRNQSGQFQRLYSDDQAAFARTVAGYRAAAEAARLADRANADRVAVEQRAINERTSNDYEARLADARARAHAIAERLRLEAGAAAADPRSRGGAAMPHLPAAPGGPDQTPAQDGLSRQDRLTATEQAIQLDELIKWVKAQASVNPNATSSH